MKLNSDAQSAIQKNLSESLVLPTSQQDPEPVEIKVQPLQTGHVQVAHALPTTFLVTPDDFSENPIIYVAVHGLKFEIGNLGEMKRVYELGVYKPAERLSDMIWHHFDKWNKS